MAGRIEGITIEFRGDTTKLQTAINKIRKESKSTERELKQIDTALKFNPTSVDLWRQKQTVLNTAVKDTEKRLQELKSAQKEMKDGNVDESSAEYMELQREILKCENQLKRYNAEVKKIPTAEIRAMGESFKQAGAKATAAGKTMTTTFTAPIVAGYTVAAKSASDYEENMNKLDVAFGDSSQAVKDWANTAREAYGLSKVQASESAAAFGALGKGIGLSEAEAANLSTSLTGLSADLGSYFNVGTDESSKALEGIFTGESEALKKFGVVMNDTNLAQFAEDQGLVWKEMDQTEKTMLRYQFVMEKTKDAQGDFSRTSDGTANSLKIFQASVQDIGVAIGTVLLPIITPIIQKITEWINKFNELSPTAQKIITIIGLVVAAIGPFLLIVGTLLSTIGNIMIFGPMIVSTLGTVLAAIGPVILIIGALVAAGVLLYKNWDVIKAKAIQIRDQLVTTWNNVKTKVTTAVNNLKTALSTAWDNIKTRVTTVWNGIKTAIITPIQTARDTIKRIIDKIKGFFPLSVGKIFSNLKVPHIDVSGGKAPFGIGGLGTKPSISVKWYDQGGIFRSPSIIGVGEKRPEFVGALDDLRDIVREETGGGGITINVYPSPGMDVKALAAEVERRLVESTRRRAAAWQ